MAVGTPYAHFDSRRSIGFLEEIIMATKEHELLADEGLEIVCSVTLQEAIEALARLVRREPVPRTARPAA
jgi:hypothetical protein